MKLLTTNFVQCAVESCGRTSSAFPLEYKDCQLVKRPIEYDAELLVNLLGKLDWAALLAVAADLGVTNLPANKPVVAEPPSEDDEPFLRELHEFLLETQIQEGTMVCKNCGHLYHIKNFIPNFLLPPHLA